jgi:hypothetical protein
MEQTVKRGDYALHLEFQAGKAGAGVCQQSIASCMLDRARDRDRLLGAEDEKRTDQPMGGAFDLRDVASVEKSPNLGERTRRLVHLHLRQRQEHVVFAAKAFEQLVEGEFERGSVKRLRR